MSQTVDGFVSAFRCWKGEDDDVCLKINLLDCEYLKQQSANEEAEMCGSGELFDNKFIVHRGSLKSVSVGSWEDKNVSWLWKDCRRNCVRTYGFDSAGHQKMLEGSDVMR
ncbi:uncharacterized protein N7496_008233 [Penicillium cataractarum]|uniref:Uncharacterized protein n=1 Tax=Penicillium cataractarum TaxID=2100454 RepID=A0A9W9S2N5_9EURO|nr:uncharacterized protein N7496_008233 [Penicillium cataractarum]KAJ5368473.1 hypothetical protein N7496_008233 [Penicillium cataractarum]